MNMTRLYQQAVSTDRTNVARSDYKHIEVYPIAGALGAEIHGVDLAQPMDEETFDEIRQAFLDHLVVFFRDQDLTPEQQKAFGRRFGDLHHNDFISEIEEHPEIVRVARAPSDRFVFGNDWHADVTYTEVPALGSVLYALEVPEFGGDTLFSNLYIAYETLSDTMKKTLEPLRGLHTAGTIFGTSGAYVQEGYQEGHKGTSLSHHEASAEVSAHPVVRVHPETGRKGIFVNSIFTVGIEGMSDEEGRAILDFLFEHATRPDFTSRFRWEKGSMAFWDNRCTLHYALNDAPGVNRLLHRITVLDTNAQA
jgi:taurine dioxygenase